MSGRAGHLFHMHQLARPTGLVALEPVNASHSADVRYYADAQGKQWVGKREIGYQDVLAESLSWFLAKECGARTPEAGYVGGVGTGDFIWLSAYVGNSQHWDSRNGNFIANDDEVGAMIAVDAITMNGDRHGQNVLPVVEDDETSLTLWAIDWGDALIGQISDYCSLGPDDIPRVDKFIRGIPISRVSTGALQAAQALVALGSAPILPTYVGVACALVLETPRQAQLLAQLRLRLLNAESVVRRYLIALEAVR